MNTVCNTCVQMPCPKRLVPRPSDLRYDPRNLSATPGHPSGINLTTQPSYLCMTSNPASGVPTPQVTNGMVGYGPSMWSGQSVVSPGGCGAGGCSPGGYSPGGYSPGGYSPGGYLPGGYLPGGCSPGGCSPGGCSPGGCGSTMPGMTNSWYNQATMPGVVSPTTAGYGVSTTANNHLLTGCGTTPCRQKATSGPIEMSDCDSTCRPEDTLDVGCLVATHASIEGNLFNRGLRLDPSWAKSTVVQETMPCQTSGKLNRKIRGPGGSLICLDDIEFENSCGIRGHVYASYHLPFENGSLQALRHVSGNPSIQNTSDSQITITTHIHFVRYRRNCDAPCVMRCEKSCDRSCDTGCSCSRCSSTSTCNSTTACTIGSSQSCCQPKPYIGRKLTVSTAITQLPAGGMTTISQHYMSQPAGTEFVLGSDCDFTSVVLTMDGDICPVQFLNMNPDPSFDVPIARMGS